jgi:hypothetical protein
MNKRNLLLNRAVLQALATAAILPLATDGFAVTEPTHTVGNVEQWVINQLVPRNGSVDLALCPHGNQISATFLQELLTTPKWLPEPCAIWIQNAVLSDSVELAGARIAHEVRLEGFQFHQPVNLPGAHFLRDVSVRGSRFEGGLDFHDGRVDGHLTLTDTAITGPADFKLARVNGNLIAAGAKFDGPADFEVMEVGKTAYFNAAAFHAECDFQGAKFGHKFEAWKGQFDGKASFDSIKVGGSAYLAEAIFAASASFGYANITDELSLEGVQFQSPTTRANFYAMRVGGQALLDRTQFLGPAEFGDSVVLKNFRATNARFLNAEGMASFFGMKVGGMAQFRQAEFRGPVSFILADISGNFEARGAKFLNMLDDTKLALASSDRLHHNTDFGSMKVGGFGVLAEVSFPGTVSFRNADFQNLHLEGTSFPAGKGKVRLEGLSFRHIRAVSAKRPGEDDHHHDTRWIDHKQSWQELKAMLAGSAAYSADVYQNLEEHFRRIGEPERADEVFLERKHQERKHALGGWSRAKSLFLWLLVAHGKRPWQALIPSALLVLFGAWIFRKDRMQVRGSNGEPNATRSESAVPARSAPMDPEASDHDLHDREFAHRPYRPFLYSLGLFLPFVDLRANDAWMPRPKFRFQWYYMRVHTMLGWILVPLGLAAVTGLIN